MQFTGYLQVVEDAGLDGVCPRVDIFLVFGDDAAGFAPSDGDPGGVGCVVVNSGGVVYTC